MLTQILIIFCVAYLAICIFLALFQRRLVYRTERQRQNPADWNAADMQEVVLKTTDGVEILGWYKPAKIGMPTMLYFHGNAGHLGERIDCLRPRIDAGYGLFMLSYRGYAGSAGKPTEQGLYQDASAALAYVKSQGVPTSSIILYGESLGTGVAVHLAATESVGVLILQAPYTSMADAAAYHYPLFPVRWLLRDKYNSLEKITKIKVPLLILYAGKDKVIPAKQSLKLFEAAPYPKDIYFFPEDQHNEFRDAYKPTIAFLQEHLILMNEEVEAV